MAEIQKSMGGCVLYGVPKIVWGMESDEQEMTMPFPMCLQVAANYMGHTISYTQIMAATGLAFSQRFHTTGWAPWALDSRTTYESANIPFERGYQAVGRNVTITDKEKNTKEEHDIIALVKHELDCGRPIIALGVVGPPEPCIITGYENEGKTVLGWNLFQHDDWLAGVGFAAPDGFDESGYFIKNNWWASTEGLMTMSADISTPLSVEEILQNGLDLMMREKTGAYGGYEYFYNGQAAYKAWAETLNDEKMWVDDAPSCHGDQQNMLRGRSIAAAYIASLAEQYPNKTTRLNECAELLRKTAECANAMHEACSGEMSNIAASKDVRTATVSLIYKAAEYEKQACLVLAEILGK